ncbi:GNAT family N-acetyltransferase [Kutzneria kofuensis]|uniref:GNAT superfamily N-acetyltransferase n=1 Tax=Kutzneria kofuensis TaxID=103725 RepID=A0A7W9KCY0_9PSEU|nr:GNAT family N-acetyltransferase [Kutzneria kofuensis]MBB5890295.1 GNAT superfamily N-acetyltransferase [Kutzneria kofuensis]
MTPDIRLVDAFAADLDEHHELHLAVSRADYPNVAPPTRETVLARLRDPDVDLGERLFWTARVDGRLAGAFAAQLPVDGNEHLSMIRLVVHPELRRRGIGTQLLRTAASVLRQRGRLIAEVSRVESNSPGARFAAALGFRTVNTSVFQLLEFAEVDPAVWDVSPPAGYRLVRWIGRAPDHLVESYARARRAIGDAPPGESAFRTPDWTVARVRRLEAAYLEHGIERRVVAAVADDQVVGLTELDLQPLRPDLAAQRDTAVLAAHRGHGLGQAMKASMLRWITADKPDVQRVWTSTAVANQYMADVNHRLGFATVRRYSVVNRELAGL